MEFVLALILFVSLDIVPLMRDLALLLLLGSVVSISSSCDSSNKTGKPKESAARSPRVSLLGPNDEVLVYEQEGDSIRLRVCQKNTARSEIEDGCQPAQGTSEVVMSERSFRALVNEGLATVDKRILSPKQKKLFQRDLLVLREMNGKPIRRVLKHSQDGGGIAYNMLLRLATVETCDPSKVEQAAAGYMCRADDVVWKIESQAYAGKRVYRDMKSGIRVTAPLDGKHSQYSAEGLCKNGFHLPTGYPAGINGKYGLPTQDSDFTTLENDHVRDVVPGIKNNWLWSSSLFPSNSVSAFEFNGYDGNIDIIFRGALYEEVVCVAR